MSVWRSKTRDIIQTLRIAPREYDNGIFADGVVQDSPEGKLIVQISDTLAKEWADTLERLLESE
jgi:hypothetical protein